MKPVASQDQPATAAGYTRLHITPLDSELLPVVVPAAALPQAQNISFHTLETFPEKRFGFVDLPAADADKLKKKLSGAVLRGVKIRVEMARKDDILQPAGAEALASTDAKKEKRSKKKDGEHKKKKRKRDGEELVGVELEEGRKVKRGWTVSESEKIQKERSKKDKDRSKKEKDKSKDKDKKQKKRETRSKFTDHPECLVKTVLPPNRVPAEGEGASEPTKRKGKKERSREVTVHEFEHTTKFPTFLKSQKDNGKGGPNLEYIEGQGWVNADGDVVESVKSTRPKPAAKQAAPKKSVVATATADDDDSTSSSGTSSDDTSSEEEEDEEDDDEEDEDTRVDAEEEDKAHSLQDIPEDKTLPLESPRPKSSGSARSLTIKIPPATPLVPKTVHPLEALYKRQAAAPGQEKPPAGEGFSFFGAGDTDDIEEDDELPPSQPPMTPFTKMDFDTRLVRSAAPTPDTAFANRKFNFWPQGEEDQDEDEELEEDTLMADAGQRGDEEEQDEDGDKPTATGDFQKWFWEHRGDLNRSWKKRRKAASKEKRYRENRARAGRAI
ncbi:uncharacterized protein E0L32_002461 [Thyridium curvatum]|uniref:Uncharacterized protein n=1 Tax=Thyridium curvatum TaxID=1093900 RepID=A0A507BIL4_9PEZI|nr:uncharacterized protein E0L32_002461 [Thyridium curvatum]TPX18604.1 hypothetical protein E0L32_002461 [Thyridium curvatum]